MLRCAFTNKNVSSHICGYIDRRKFVVNLDCNYGHHLLDNSFQKNGRGCFKGGIWGYCYFCQLRASLYQNTYMEIWYNIQVIIYRFSSSMMIHHIIMKKSKLFREACSTLLHSYFLKVIGLTLQCYSVPNIT